MFSCVMIPIPIMGMLVNSKKMIGKHYELIWLSVIIFVFMIWRQALIWRMYF